MEPLGPWPAGRRVAVAVSGGADSLCLALLVREWAGSASPPLALVVDHGLRAGSEQDAAVAAKSLSAMGIPPLVLRLELSAGSRLQERARASRHAALAEASARAGLPDLLLGHHLDDQVETIAMRAHARSGPDGLAGMSLVSERHRIRIVRPLLPIRSARLRATLCAAGIAWFEDPSNADLRFERARLRSSSSRKQEIAAVLHREAEATWLARHVMLHDAGFAVLAPGPMPVACLSRLLQAISGQAYPPPRAQVERLAAEPRPATLSGVRLVDAGRLGPGLLACREEAAMSDSVPAKQGAVWDGRFALKSQLPSGWRMGAYGKSGTGGDRFPSVIRVTLPALYDAVGTLQAVPHAGLVTEAHEIRVIFSPAVPAAPSFLTNAPQSAP